MQVNIEPVIEGKESGDLRDLKFKSGPTAVVHMHDTVRYRDLSFLASAEDDGADCSLCRLMAGTFGFWAYRTPPECHRPRFKSR